MQDLNSSEGKGLETSPSSHFPVSENRSNYMEQKTMISLLPKSICGKIFVQDHLQHVNHLIQDSSPHEEKTLALIYFRRLLSAGR